MKTVGELFEVKYGHNYELCHLEEDPDGIAFVSRTASNNGISARVRHTGEPPTPAGAITVALGGSVLSTFLQPEPCYEGRDIATLTSKHAMTDKEKLWYAYAIRANRFRFSFGRQANRELPNIKLPPPPDWIKTAIIPDFSWIAQKAKYAPDKVDIQNWGEFPLSQLFEISEARGPSSAHAQSHPGSTPFISAGGFNNGVSCYTDYPPTHPAGALSLVTIGAGASGVSFFQPNTFCANPGKALILTNNHISIPAKLFIATAITSQDWRFNYGRACNGERARQLPIPLPVNADSEPDYALMERYILNCKFSAALAFENLRDMS